MSPRPNVGRSVLTVLGLLLLTAAWSLPALVEHEVLPRGFYLIIAIPFVSMVGFVYVTASVWQYLLSVRELSSSSPRGVGIGIVTVVILGGIIASSWAFASVTPSLRVFIHEWQLLLPPATLLTWFPAGEMLDADRLEGGVVLLGVPLTIVGLSLILVGILNILMIVYLFVCALVGLPVLLLGSARAPT